LTQAKTNASRLLYFQERERETVAAVAATESEKHADALAFHVFFAGRQQRQRAVILPTKR
jgi:hypothetical protein